MKRLRSMLCLLPFGVAAMGGAVVLPATSAVAQLCPPTGGTPISVPVPIEVPGQFGQKLTAVSHPSSAPIPVSIPAGPYRVVQSSSDPSHPQIPDQTNERWYAVFSGATGVVGTTPTIPDLPNNVTSGSVATGAIVLTGNATSVTYFHVGGAGSDGVDSIYASALILTPDGQYPPCPPPPPPQSAVTVNAKFLGTVPTGVTGVRVSVDCSLLAGGTSQAYTADIPVAGSTAVMNFRFTNRTTCTSKVEIRGTGNLGLGSIAVDVGGVNQPTTPTSPAVVGANAVTTGRLPIPSSTTIDIRITYPNTPPPPPPPPPPIPPALTVGAKFVGKIPAGVTGANVTVSCRDLEGGTSLAYTAAIPRAGGFGVMPFRFTSATTCTSRVELVGDRNLGNLGLGSITVAVGGVDQPTTPTTPFVFGANAVITGPVSIPSHTAVDATITYAAVAEAREAAMAPLPAPATPVVVAPVVVAPVVVAPVGAAPAGSAGPAPSLAPKVEVQGLQIENAPAAVVATGVVGADVAFTGAQSLGMGAAALILIAFGTMVLGAARKRNTAR
jgi:hypothetical protein